EQWNDAALRVEGRNATDDLIVGQEHVVGGALRVAADTTRREEFRARLEVRGAGASRRQEVTGAAGVLLVVAVLRIERGEKWRVIMLATGRACGSAPGAEGRVGQQCSGAPGITEAELLLRILAGHEHTRAEHAAVIGDE